MNEHATNIHNIVKEIEKTIAEAREILKLNEEAFLAIVVMIGITISLIVWNIIL